MDNSTHVPTPFKNALSPDSKPGGDLKEDSEANTLLITEDKVRPKKQKRMPGLQWSPIKNVCKSLALEKVDKDMKLVMCMLHKWTNLLISSSITMPGIKKNNSLLNEGFLQARPKKLVAAQNP